MAINLQDLQDLLKSDPSAYVVNAGNKIFVHDQSGKMQFSLPNASKQLQAYGIPVTKLEKIPMSARGEFMRSKQIGKIVTPKNWQKETITNEVIKTAEAYKKNVGSAAKALTKVPKASKIPFAAVLASKQNRSARGHEQVYVNTILSEFLSDFFSKNSGRSAKSIDKAWNLYAGAKKIPMDEGVEKDFLKEAKKIQKAFKADSKIQKDLRTGVHKQVLQYKNADFDVQQDVLMTKDRIYLFSDKPVGDKAAAKITNALISTYSTSQKQVVVMTPQGSKHGVMSKDGRVAINGHYVMPNNFNAYNRAYRALEGQRDWTQEISLKDATNKHKTRQAKIAASAVDQADRLVKMAAGSYDVSDRAKLEKFLKTGTVADLRAFSKVADGDWRALREYRGFDGSNISDIIPEKTRKEILGTMSTTNTSKAKEIYRSKLDNVVKLGKSMGISSEAIYKDLGHIGNKKTITSAELNAIDAMQEHFMTAQSSTNPKLAKFLKHDPRSALEYIVKNSSDSGFVKRFNLDSHSMSNPLLNLQGNLRAGYVKTGLDNVRIMAGKGELQKIPTELLTTWGEHLSDKEKPLVKKYLQRNARVVLKHTPKSKWPDTKLKLRDLAYSFEDTFGGPREVEDVLSNIKARNLGFNSETQRQFNMSVDAFAHGSTNESTLLDSNNLDSRNSGTTRDSAEYGDEYNKLFKRRSQQIESGSGILRNMTDSELSQAAFTKTGRNVHIGGYEATDLYKTIENYKYKMKIGKMSLPDVQNLNVMASGLGYDDMQNPRGAVSFLDNYYKASLGSDFPGIDPKSQIARVNLTKPLVKSLFKLGESESKAMSIGPKGEAHKMGLVNYVSDRRADWSYLFEAVHGDKLNNMQLIFGEKVDDKRAFIMKHLNHPNVDAGAMGNLTDLYSKTNVFTSYDERAYESLKAGVIPGSKGLISPKIDTDAILSTLTRSYDLKPMEAKPGENYLGLKTSQDNRTKVRTKSGLTNHRRKQALTWISDSGKMKDFQAFGNLDRKNPVMGQLDRDILVGRLKASSKDFLNFQDRVHGQNTNPSVLKDLHSGIDGSVGLIEKAVKAGDWQTANAHVKALEELDGSFVNGKKNWGAKVHGEMYDHLQLDAKGTYGSKIASSSGKYFGVQAAKYAEASGAPLINQGELYSVFESLRDGGMSKAIKSEQLGLKGLGYAKSTNFVMANKNLRNAAEKLLANVDPMSKVENHETTKARSYNKKTNNSTVKPSAPDPLHFSAPTAKRKGPYVSPFGWGKAGKTSGARKNPSFRGYKFPMRKKVDNRKWSNTWQEEQLLYPKRTLDMSDATLEEIAANLLGLSQTSMKFSKGGKVPGKGTKDEVAALLTKGEVVIDRKTAETLGINNDDDYNRFKSAILNGQVGKFEYGGIVKELQGYLNFDSFDEDQTKKVRALLDDLSTFTPKKGEERLLSGLFKQFGHKGVETTAATAAKAKPKNIENIMPSSARAESKTQPKMGRYDMKRGLEVVADRVTIDLADNKSILKFEGMNTGQLKDLVERSDSNRKGQAYSNLETQRMSGLLGLDQTDVKQISLLGSEHSRVSLKDISPRLKEAVDGLDIDNLTEGLKNSSKEIEAGFKKINKASISFGETIEADASASAKLTSKLRAESSVLKDLLGVDLLRVVVTLSMPLRK